MTAAIRALVPGDRAAWGALWDGYLAFYGTARDAALKDATFARLLPGGDPAMEGWLALAGGRPAGLVHLIFHRHCWHQADILYLQDLFVAPEHRGTGLGRALIEHAYVRADAAGAADVYWLTQADNAQARALYDRVGRLTDFVKYARGRRA